MSSVADIICKTNDIHSKLMDTETRERLKAFLQCHLLSLDHARELSMSLASCWRVISGSGIWGGECCAFDQVTNIVDLIKWSRTSASPNLKLCWMNFCFCEFLKWQSRKSSFLHPSVSLVRKMLGQRKEEPRNAVKQTELSFEVLTTTNFLLLYTGARFSCKLIVSEPEKDLLLCKLP